MSLVEYAHIAIDAGGPRLVISLRRHSPNLRVEIGLTDNAIGLNVEKEKFFLPFSVKGVMEWLASVRDAGYINVEIRYPYGDAVGILVNRVSSDDFMQFLKTCVKD